MCSFPIHCLEPIPKKSYLCLYLISISLIIIYAVAHLDILVAPCQDFSTNGNQIKEKKVLWICRNVNWIEFHVPILWVVFLCWLDFAKVCIYGHYYRQVYSHFRIRCSRILGMYFLVLWITIQLSGSWKYYNERPRGIKNYICGTFLSAGDT